MNKKIIRQDFKRIRYFAHPCLYGPPIPKTRVVTDIVFCLDCSRSMNCCIENVRDNINTFVESLNAEQDAFFDWRMRVVGYGDLEIGEEIQNRNDFVSTIPEFQAQVARIEMCGGCDAPQSTLDAIITAAKTSKWRERSQKVIVVFTDAITKDIDSSTGKTFNINTFEHDKNL